MKSQGERELPVAQAAANTSETIGKRIYRFLERYEVAVLCTLLLVFFIAVVLRSTRKTIWFDEMFTAILVQQPDWQHFVRAMPTEGNPPLNALCARAFAHLFGMGAFALRLPSMLGYVGALGGVYLFIRRECGRVYGLVAIFIMLSQPSWKYAFEARPYGLLLFFFTLALVGWQAATHATETPESKRRLLPLFALAAGIAGCILSHHIGALTVGFPLLIGEGVRTWKRRKIDWQVLIAGLIGFSSLVLTLKMIAKTRSAVLVHARNISYPITLAKLHEYSHRIPASLNQVLDGAFLWVIAIFVVACWRLRPKLGASQVASYAIDADGAYRLRPHILAAALAAIALIPLAWLFMIPGGGWFFCRYGIGAVVGITFLCCLLLRRGGTSRTALMVLTLLAGAMFTTTYLNYVAEYPLEKNALRVLEESPGTVPIVVAQPFRFTTFWWHGSENLKARIFYLTGTNDDDAINEQGIIKEKPYWNAPMGDYDEFLHTHDHFFLVCSPLKVALLNRFRANGFSLTPVESLPDYYEARRVPPLASTGRLR